MKHMPLEDVGVAVCAVPDSVASAEAAGLVFVTDEDPGIVRVAVRDSFRYKDAGGKIVKDARTLARIRGLAIPPAWTNVWICPDERGHIQATGRDSRNRKQYKYHADWHRVRDDAKFDRLLEFGRSLPALRDVIQSHVSHRGIGREKVLATVVHLLDTTLIRVGNPEYARTNKSFGLTTLQDRHVSCSSGEIRFKFRGKTGKDWRLRVNDRRIAKIVKSCQDLPGQHLFQYEDDEGTVRRVTSADVNSYLRDISGTEISAKDFRTWAGTVIATMELGGLPPPASETAAKRTLRQAIGVVASRLGNTVTICRKCYIHPEVVDCYLEGALADVLSTLETDPKLALPDEEARTLALLEKRLGAGKPA